jgi:hypothetical protein
LEFVEETSKIMLLNEFEILYWFLLLERYLKVFSSDRDAVRLITARKVRLLFFLGGMFVKKFFLQSQNSKSQSGHEKRLEQIRCIEAYLKEYHYSNFEQAYD